MLTAEIVPEPERPSNEADGDQLAYARKELAKIRRAAGVASFNGWATCLFAGLSAPFAIYSFRGAFVTAGLAIVAYFEFQGRKRLLQFDPKAARLLGFNQLGFLSVIVIYSLWSISAGVDLKIFDHPQIAQHAELRETIDDLKKLDDFEELIQYTVVLIYSLVIALSTIFQGGNAWYYFSRRKIIEAYLRNTSDSTVDMQQPSANK